MKKWKTWKCFKINEDVFSYRCTKSEHPCDSKRQFRESLVPGIQKKKSVLSVYSLSKFILLYTYFFFFLRRIKFNWGENKLVQEQWSQKYPSATTCPCNHLIYWRHCRSVSCYARPRCPHWKCGDWVRFWWYAVERNSNTSCTRPRDGCV